MTNGKNQEELVLDSKKQVTIALDCMGGDNAPGAIIEGADIVARSSSEISFLLFGDENKIKPFLDKCPALKRASKVRHTPDFISSGEKPSVALRKGRDSSMRLAIDTVKSREADAVVSAGNTGALMIMSKMVLKPLPSIDRPAIAQMLPNQKGSATVLLDMGANIECDSDNLCQFAVMGNAFARVALKLDKPSIGLLNIGSEEMKGGDAIKNAASRLRESELGKSFYGYVEGNDILRGTVDVVVTDGFSGNIALKSIEGTAEFFAKILKDAFHSSIFAKIGYFFACAALKNVSKKANPKTYNGALLVGLNGITVKSHGNADKVAFSNAVRVAISLVEEKINDKIMAEIAETDFGQTFMEDSSY